MTELSSAARGVLADAGVSIREWVTYGGWLVEVLSGSDERQWVPETEWRGDECGCTDDRCVGYHHDEHEECPCLPALLEDLAQKREAYLVWEDYRAAVDAEDGRGDLAATRAAHARAAAWIKRYFPRAQSFSLDALVNGVRGMSVTYPGPHPGYVGSTPEGERYRQRVWSEGTNAYGYVSHERTGASVADGR
jgi:hypothetical protein